MFKALFYSQRGSTTIEAVLIVSAMIMALAGLIFAFLLMNQQVLLSRTAALVAEEAAQLWLEDNGLYYRLLEDNLLGGDQEFTYTSQGLVDVDKLPQEGEGFYNNKFTEIRALAYARLNKALRKPETTTINIEYHNNLLTRRITVTLSQALPIPLGNLQRFFQDQDTITLTGTGSAVITDPAGYIRDLDLALEYGTKVKEAVKMKLMIAKVKEGVKK